MIETLGRTLGHLVSEDHESLEEFEETENSEETEESGETEQNDEYEETEESEDPDESEDLGDIACDIVPLYQSLQFKLCPSPQRQTFAKHCVCRRFVIKSELHHLKVGTNGLLV